jgi:hypothetical protein
VQVQVYLAVNIRKSGTKEVFKLLGAGQKKIPKKMLLAAERHPVWHEVPPDLGILRQEELQQL